MTALFIVGGLVAIFWVLTLVGTYRMRARLRRVDATERFGLADDAPRVTVCVAARDEEAKLGACLESLLLQDHPNLRIVVANDRSRDGTRAIMNGFAARDPRVVAIDAPEPPEGWSGKTHAMHHAVLASEGAWVLMTDADTVHRPNAVRNGVGYATREGLDALSLAGEVELTTFASQLVVPQLLSFLAAKLKSGKRKGLGDHQNVGANGGYLLVSRAAYDAAGGMEAVRDEIAEDTAHAVRLAESGARYAYAGGVPPLWRTEMYRTLGEIYRGFARNPNFGLGGDVGKAIALTLFMWLFPLVPVATLLAGVLTGEGPFFWFGIAQYVVVLGSQVLIRRRAGFNPWMSPLAPLGSVLAWAMMMGWFWSARRGKTVVWKGRVYAGR